MGADPLFSPIKSECHSHFYNYYKRNLGFQVIGNAAKLLVLVACLLATLAIHTVGFLVIFIFQHLNSNMKLLHSKGYVNETGNSLVQKLATEVKFIGLIQDFSLLPQIIGNIFWQMKSRPLTKSYYIGFTVERLLFHV